MKKDIYYQRGQALLIIILVMVVALTVGLSVASRSITNLRNSSDEAQSQKAFAAAEAGIEQALKTNTSIEGANGQIIDSSTNTYIKHVSINDVNPSANGNTFLVNGGNLVTKDQGADVWLSDQKYDKQWSGPLQINWADVSETTDCSNAALEVIIISGTKSDPKSTRYAVDPCATRITDNHFSQIDGSSQYPYTYPVSKTLHYKTSITVTDGLFARIIPLYKDTYLGVTATSDLPPQGTLYTSTGKSGSAQRKITYYQSYPSLPPELFYGLFSH